MSDSIKNPLAPGERPQFDVVEALRSIADILSARPLSAAADHLASGRIRAMLPYIERMRSELADAHDDDALLKRHIERWNDWSVSAGLERGTVVRAMATVIGATVSELIVVLRAGVKELKALREDIERHRRAP